MLVVAGLSLKNLKPRVWDPTSLYYLPDLRAVMVSYADFHRRQSCRRAAMESGLRSYLGVPEGVAIYLDNGAFYFLEHGAEALWDEYREFVAHARPDWWPIPQDFIPTPRMSLEEQRGRFVCTMKANLACEDDGYVPVIHIGSFLTEYVRLVKGNGNLSAKPAVALGGIVPNLLRAQRAMPYDTILGCLRQVRAEFADKQVHVFGLGGTATLHLGALLGIDSADSSGWRNRAARGLVQLPGGGDRIVAEFGSWRGRKANADEWCRLAACPCPACRLKGLDGLKADGIDGASNRAAHNLWVLLNEARLIDAHLAAGTYKDWYRGHVDNSVYLPLIQNLVA